MFNLPHAPALDRAALLGAACAAALFAAPAGAVTVFDGGGPVVLNTPLADDVIVSGDTDLSVEAGGSIAPPSPAGDGKNGVSIDDFSSVTVDGGSVTGGARSIGVGDGDGVSATDAATVDVRAGSVSGGDSAAPNVFGGDGVQATGATSVSVSGGVVRGGDSASTLGGDGVIALNAADLTISGGEIVGGDGAFGGDGVLYNATGEFMMSGGTVRGGGPGGDGVDIGAGTVVIDGGAGLGADGAGGNGSDGLRIQTLGTADISGGAFTGGAGNFGGRGAFIGGGTQASIFDGVFTGGAGSVRGGAGLLTNGGATVDIHGGVFSAGAAVGAGDPGLSLFGAEAATINLRGGLLTGSIELAEIAVLNVFGQGLSFDNGLLIGTLFKGDAISVQVALFDDAQVNLFEVAPVPLPAAAWLLLAGLGALGVAGRRRA